LQSSTVNVVYVTNCSSAVTETGVRQFRLLYICSEHSQAQCTWRNDAPLDMLMIQLTVTITHSPCVPVRSVKPDKLNVQLLDAKYCVNLYNNNMNYNVI